MSVQYENRLPEEGINVTPHNPFWRFIKLMLAAILFVAFVVVALNLIGSTVASKIPFRYEVALMDKIDMELGESDAEDIVEYLNELSGNLAEHMDIPEGMQFDIHFKDDPTFNAFATLGGNLVFHRSLLSSMPNENALAMVMAHEMSHVLHRHPASGIGGGLSSAIALMVLNSAGGGGLAGDILTSSGSLTQLSFSRDMEEAADSTAIRALASYYGHINGAAGLFELMDAARGISEDGEEDSAQEIFGESLEKVSEMLNEFSSTHPLGQNRIDALYDIATENNWSFQGDITPLPAAYQDWLGTSHGSE